MSSTDNTRFPVIKVKTDQYGNFRASLDSPVSANYLSFIGNGSNTMRGVEAQHNLLITGSCGLQSADTDLQITAKPPNLTKIYWDHRAALEESDMTFGGFQAVDTGRSSDLMYANATFMIEGNPFGFVSQDRDPPMPLSDVKVSLTPFLRVRSIPDVGSSIFGRDKSGIANLSFEECMKGLPYEASDPIQISATERGWKAEIDGEWQTGFLGSSLDVVAGRDQVPGPKRVPGRVRVDCILESSPTEDWSEVDLRFAKLSLGPDASRRHSIRELLPTLPLLHSLALGRLCNFVRRDDANQDYTAADINLDDKTHPGQINSDTIDIPLSTTFTMRFRPVCKFD